MKQGGANEPKMGDSPFLARWHRPALTRRGYRPERRRRELRVTRRGYHSKRRRRESVTSPVGVTSAPQALGENDDFGPKNHDFSKTCRQVAKRLVNEAGRSPVGVTVPSAEGAS